MTDPDAIRHVFSSLAEEINANAARKGFWPEVATPAQLAEAFVGSDPTFVRNLADFKSTVEAFVVRARQTMPRQESELIALEHSELSELLEAVRHGNPPSTKIPGFSLAEEELADVVIRCLDHAHAFAYRLAEAIIAKMAYNAGRDHKHGKAF